MKTNTQRAKRTELSSSDRFDFALANMHRRGVNQFSALTLAEEMYPDCRDRNANGQAFNLSAGVCGRMLRKYRGAVEVDPKNRVWEIVPEFIKSNTEIADGEK